MSTALRKFINPGKRSVVAFLFLVACTPLSVFALGFGKPAVESALGEPLRIVLPLTALEPNEIDELVARLAAPSWFQLSGLDYGEINDQLIVSVNPGLSALVISTRQPVSQVVVPLVIELEGPRKVMRKQFTVLINPATYEQAVSANASVNLPSTLNLAEGVTGNVTGSNDSSSASSAVVTALSNSDSSSNSSTGISSDANPVADTNLTAQSLPARADRVVVSKGDSLSTIVDRFLPDGANRYQGRMAFYNVNPSAFPDGNIHTLTRGAELVVPPAQDILALPAAQARRDYKTLAQSPVPGAAVQNQDDSNNTASGQSEGASVVEAEDGPEATGNQEQSDGDFRLSLLEVEEQDNPAEENDENKSASENNQNTVTDESLALTGATGEQFEMQGFTMKLSVMNAYIVELQEENQELKSRVETLEQQVKALIARDAGGEDSPGSITSSIAATATGETGTTEPEGEDSIAAEGAAEDQPDLASVLETSPELLNEEEFAIDSAIESDSDTGVGDESVDTTVTELDSDYMAIEQIDGSSIEAALGQLPTELSDTDEFSNTEEPSATDEPSDTDAAASLTVEQMLEELDAELGKVGDEGAESVEETEIASDEEAIVDDAEVEEVVRTSVDSVSQAEAAPQATFRQGLMDKAKSFLGDLNSPILQLLVAVLLLAALLFAWMMKRGNKTKVEEKQQSEVANYASTAGNVGVSYDVSDNQLSLLEDDEEDDQWMQQQDVNIDNIDTLEGSDVDLITQSEVYLTYNRPMQAVQALTEEYAKPDTDKFVVGSRLIKVFEKIGSGEERNTAMRNFIVTLNNDIEEFTNSEWDALRFDLDALRRQEQSSAIDAATEPAVEMNSFNPEEQLDKPSPELTLDESSIDLDFHKEDKTGS